MDHVVDNICHIHVSIMELSNKRKLSFIEDNRKSEFLRDSENNIGLKMGKFIYYLKKPLV